MISALDENSCCVCCKDCLCERGRTECATGGPVCERWGTCIGVRVRVVCSNEFCYALDTLAVAQREVTLRPPSLWPAVGNQSVSYTSDFPFVVLVCESRRPHSRSRTVVCRRVMKIYVNFVKI